MWPGVLLVVRLVGELRGSESDESVDGRRLVGVEVVGRGRIGVDGCAHVLGERREVGGVV